MTAYNTTYGIPVHVNGITNYGIIASHYFSSVNRTKLNNPSLIIDGWTKEHPTQKAYIKDTIKSNKHSTKPHICEHWLGSLSIKYAFHTIAIDWTFNIRTKNGMAFHVTFLSDALRLTGDLLLGWPILWTWQSKENNEILATVTARSFHQVTSSL